MSELLVHSIETFGTHDGPGIRLIVFAQGCYFACAYCHNPDSRGLTSGDARTYSSEEILALLEKNRPYFKNTGGLTVSGGEPTVQAAGVFDLFTKAQAAGFHCTLDTCGAVCSPLVRKLYDIAEYLLDAQSSVPVVVGEMAYQSGNATVSISILGSI